MKIGDIVKFKRMVDPGDDKILMKVLDIRPNKIRNRMECMVEDIVDWPIRPQHEFPVDDLEVVPQGQPQGQRPDGFLVADWVAKNCKFARSDAGQVVSQCEQVQSVLVHLLDTVRDDPVAMPKMNKAWDLVSEVLADYYQRQKMTDMGSPT